MRHEFWDALNAVSITVRDESVLGEILDQISGIKMIEPVVIHDRPDYIKEPLHVHKQSASRMKKYAVHDLTGVKEVHESLKLFGNGIKIGIIDSGVDYHHPALGGCFGPGCKIAYGTDFVGDDGNSPDDDPMTDCDGHGTHVAGIIAANDTAFLGVAPQAILGAYRVFGCKGGTSNDLIMKALLRAAADGMQVINLSLGGPGGWRQDREARLADALAIKGTIIVAAMGNEGQMGLFESSSPGVAESVITVASIENESRSNMYFMVDQSALKGKSVDVKDADGDKDDANKKSEQPRSILYMGDFDMNLTNTALVQVAPGTSGQVKEDACHAIDTDLKGKIALIRRGGCTFKVKVANAALANATGVIIMDNVPSNGFAGDTSGAIIKSRTITLDDGEYLLRTIAEEKKEVEGIKLVAGVGPKEVVNPNGGFLSIFSSMGPDSELNSKPDIAAPGGQIWSTFPIKFGSYATLSGTSMATPYVVGCVALYLEGLPNADRSAKGIKVAFQNSAQPRLQQTGYKGFASVTQQGAGLLSMMSVLKTRVIITPSSISLNDTVNMNSKQKITITNNGQTPLQYELDVVSAAGLLPFDKNMMVEKNPQIITAKASVKVPHSTVIVAPGSSMTVEMMFTGPDTNPSQYVIYSGYIRFTPRTISSESPVMHVPYMGMHGNYKNVNVLDPVFGLRIFDARGRPLYASRSRGLGSASRQSSSRNDTLKAGSGGAISKKTRSIRFNAPDASTATPSASESRPRRSPGLMKIVFRMITASEVLVLDLVSDKGDDPYQVKSYGVLKNGIARYVSRSDQIEGNAFQVMGWDGQVLLDDGVRAKPADAPVGQKFRLRISLLKHFGNQDNDIDFESHLTEPFTLS
ncbi:peptidase S8/S53 domain-containing protein [Gamsiella multidivaricata]|uniref:peptidase S8/S53 domain-containing protein n=1 Tax=Gamsiella multidivaricata TaxID=101098 RepID=UPI00222106B5|nr:peptidase S8/S53 domain-containing protein [Gamsiella multidivaricata]KAI7816561.1 peptidase S8/S53 domain-containing protein [Gamsiella multidivaricata]